MLNLVDHLHVLAGSYISKKVTIATGVNELKCVRLTAGGRLYSSLIPQDVVRNVMHTKTCRLNSNQSRMGLAKKNLTSTVTRYQNRSDANKLGLSKSKIPTASHRLATEVPRRTGYGCLRLRTPILYLWGRERNQMVCNFPQRISISSIQKGSNTGVPYKSS